MIRQHIFLAFSLYKYNSNVFLPYGRHDIQDPDISAVVDVLRSSFLTQGHTVPQFEHAVAERL